MSKKSGFILSIQGGGKAIAYHSQQEEQFKELKKFFIHYLTDDFKSILIDGKPKTGLKNIDQLILIGYTD